MLSDALFSAGCLWCVEHYFQQVTGVKEAIPAFTPSELCDVPSNIQEMMVLKSQGHYRESIFVRFDEEEISYSDLLDHFYQIIEPLDDGGSYIDRGFCYTSAIHCFDEKQWELAYTKNQEIESKLGAKPAVALIQNGVHFLLTESHRNFAQKNPKEYQHYLSQRHKKKPH